MNRFRRAARRTHLTTDQVRALASGMNAMTLSNGAATITVRLTADVSGYQAALRHANRVVRRHAIEMTFARRRRAYGWPWFAFLVPPRGDA